MPKNLSHPPILQNKIFWPHRYMYIIYIYNIMEQNSLNCPGKQLWGLLVEILPKARDQWEYGWALSYLLGLHLILLWMVHRRKFLHTYITNVRFCKLHKRALVSSQGQASTQKCPILVQACKSVPVTLWPWKPYVSIWTPTHWLQLIIAHLCDPTAWC